MKRKPVHSQNKPVQYAEGDAFAIPFDDGQWGVAVVVRKAMASKKFGVFSAYGFDRLFDRRPVSDDLNKLTLYDAIAFGEFGGRLVAEGKWPILGAMPGFNRQDWIVAPRAWKGPDGKLPADPARQYIVIVEEVELRTVGLSNASQFVDTSDLHLLPIDRGNGDSYALSVLLHSAVCYRDPWSLRPVTPRALTV